MKLRLARGRAALHVPPEFSDVSRLALRAQRAVERGVGNAGALSRRELAALHVAENALGHRLHKGHALHLLGMTTLTSDQEAARTLFHAALIEDIRTEEGLADTPAQQTLQELYGEPTVMLERLVTQAVNSTIDPLHLARQFEAAEVLPPYRGFRRGWRSLSDLDGILPEQLVFVGGAHANPAGVMALWQAVREEGLTPAVVVEFVDFSANVYVKSETIMRRCSLVLLDVLFQAGWDHELHIAQELGLPVFAGFLAWSAGEPPHSNAMTAGFEARAGIRPVGATDPETLAREARRWIRERAVSRRNQSSAFDVVPAPGTATVPTVGSNTPLPYPGGVPTSMPTNLGLAISTGADIKVYSSRVTRRPVRPPKDQRDGGG